MNADRALSSSFCPYFSVFNSLSLVSTVILFTFSPILLYKRLRKILYRDGGNLSIYVWLSTVSQTHFMVISIRFLPAVLDIFSVLPLFHVSLLTFCLFFPLKKITLGVCSFDESSILNGFSSPSFGHGSSINVALLHSNCLLGFFSTNRNILCDMTKRTKVMQTEGELAQCQVHQGVLIPCFVQ